MKIYLSVTFNYFKSSQKLNLFTFTLFCSILSSRQKQISSADPLCRRPQWIGLSLAEAQTQHLNTSLMWVPELQPLEPASTRALRVCTSRILQAGSTDQGHISPVSILWPKLNICPDCELFSFLFLSSFITQYFVKVLHKKTFTQFNKHWTKAFDT